ncbi:MAG: hypothetical protein KAW93_03140, partial [Methanogenium sp.]|nr:hypothetical protein [Methanogenium sp.]
MSGNCTFIRMLQEKDKGDGLKITIKDLTIGADKSIIFTVDPEFFLQIPNSPFAYWVSNCLCQKFEEFSQFEQNYGEVRMGLGTRDDFRFIRLSWEITPKKINFTPRTNINFYEEHKIAEIYLKETKNGKKWSFFAKGGEYSPYYSDIHLVVNWENEGNEIKDLRFNNGKIKSCVRNEDYYYKSGLTWSRRTTSRFNLKVLPAGAIFADLGNIIIPFNEKLKLPYLGLFLSDIYFSLMKLSLGAEDAAARTYDIGIIQRLPVPKLSDNNITLLTNLMIESILLKMKVLSLVEIARIFTLPVFNVQNNSIKDCFSKSKKSIDEIEMILDENQSKIDQIAYNIYEIKENDRQLIETNVDFRPSPLEGLEINYNSISANILSYILGSIFGRWDIRYATGEKEPPELPDPFAPLPACSPGMLQGEDGLPLAPHEIATDYPLVVDADGILVDDEGHSDDIIARIRDVLILIWADRADAIEKEACEILGVKSLRDYFRKPGAGGFWDGHVKRYSKSRRKAPIYWLLQSAKKNY